MKNKPVISVVTVTFNCQDIIKRTLDSYVAQDYVAKRLLVIDGGSTDGTLEIVRSYGAVVDVLVSEPDRGIYDAMNKSASYVRPGIVHYLNAGDLYSRPDAMSLVAASFDDDVGMVYSDLARYDEGGAEQIISQAHGLSSCLKIYQLCHQSVFFRFDKALLLYDPAFKICADFKVMVNYWHAGMRTLHIGLPLVSYLNGGFSDQRVKQLILEKRRIVKEAWPDGVIARVNRAYLSLLLWWKWWGR